MIVVLWSLTVAAEDLGLAVQDLNHVHTRTRYTTCISEDLGGSGNPAVTTGIGNEYDLISEFMNICQWL